MNSDQEGQVQLGKSCTSAITNKPASEPRSSLKQARETQPSFHLYGLFKLVGAIKPRFTGEERYCLIIS